MAMNRVHAWLCASERWARGVEERYLPWALAGIELGDRVLEIGPGYGATTRVLLDRVPALTALEIDPQLANRLSERFGAKLHVVQGDGAAMPLPSDSYSGVTCFTMLHHVPSVGAQDRLFSEAFRVLEPGGTFAGADGVATHGFRLLHLFDTMVVVDPATLPHRLATAGFVDIDVAVRPRVAFKFRARKPVRV
ncbi:class I SAM-dependent methyltransferase [Sorangium sp. So ce1182]|uniref:class I SAM-dependent methyltransferase n=1 Tax=Sorangium sp. So ce1182 TaxID=3133334 RepID=UPI003F5E51E9